MPETAAWLTVLLLVVIASSLSTIKQKMQEQTTYLHGIREELMKLREPRQ